MTNWVNFPSRIVEAQTPLFRIHRGRLDPAWFNTDSTGRFDPPPSHRGRYGVCYLGIEPLAAYVEVFGRIRAIPQTEIASRRLSELSVDRDLRLAYLHDRSVLGDYAVTADYSTGGDYEPAQELASHLFDAGFDGILYRIRHDPALTLEAVALFGEPGETPGRFTSAKTGPIDESLIEAGRQFHIEVIPPAPLP